MTESDLYVRVKFYGRSTEKWRWYITVFRRSSHSSYSDREINHIHTDLPMGRTVANYRAKRMLKKEREREARGQSGTEWIIE